MKCADRQCNCFGQELENTAYCPLCGIPLSDFQIELQEYAEGEWLPVKRFFNCENPTLRLKISLSEKAAEARTFILKTYCDDSDCEWLVQTVDLSQQLQPNTTAEHLVTIAANEQETTIELSFIKEKLTDKEKERLCKTCIELFETKEPFTELFSSDSKRIFKINGRHQTDLSCARTHLAVYPAPQLVITERFPLRRYADDKHYIDLKAAYELQGQISGLYFTASMPKLKPKQIYNPDNDYVSSHSAYQDNTNNNDLNRSDKIDFRDFSGTSSERINSDDISFAELEIPGTLETENDAQENSAPIYDANTKPLAEKQDYTDVLHLSCEDLDIEQKSFRAKLDNISIAEDLKTEVTFTAHFSARIGQDRPRVGFSSECRKEAAWMLQPSHIVKPFQQKDADDPKIEPWQVLCGDLGFDIERNDSRTFTVVNTSKHAVLRLKGISILHEPAFSLKVSDELQLPVDISPDEHCQIPIAFESLPLYNPQGSNNYSADLVLTCEYPDANLYAEKREFAYRIAIECAPIENVSGFLAVDFGTSASCAAIVTDFEQKIFNIETSNDVEDNKKDNLLSYISYIGAKNSPESCMVNAIGYNAYKSKSGDYADSVFYSPKRHISEETIQVTPAFLGFKVPLYIGSVISEFYKHIAMCSAKEICKGHVFSNEQEYTQFRFNKFVITHPSRFNRQKKEVLEKAARQAFSELYRCEPDIKLIEEPLAAALIYLIDPKTYAKQHEAQANDDITFTVFVYDCGGGTTDFCCLEVHSNRTLVVMPENANNAPLTITGNLRSQAIEELCIKHGLNDPQKIYEIKKVIEQEDPQLRRWWKYIPVLRRLNIPFEAREAADKCKQLNTPNIYSYKVELTVLNSSGDPSFGGDYITEQIKDLLLTDAINFKLEESGTPDKIILQKDAVANPTDTWMLQRYKHNDWLLFDIAENIKTHQPLDNSYSNLNIYLTNDNVKTVPEATSFIDEAFRREVHESIPHALAAPVDTLNTEAKGLFKRTGRGNNPDVVLVTGRASKWEHLRETIKQTFNDVPSDNIIFNDAIAKNKHCVALGAGLLSYILSGPINQGTPGVHITTLRKECFTTASIGYIYPRIVDGQTVNEFHELICTGSKFTDNQPIAGREAVFIYNNHFRIEIYESDRPGLFQITPNDYKSYLRKIGYLTVTLPEAPDPLPSLKLRAKLERCSGQALLSFDLLYADNAGQPLPPITLIPEPGMTINNNGTGIFLDILNQPN